MDEIIQGLSDVPTDVLEIAEAELRLDNGKTNVEALAGIFRMIGLEAVRKTLANRGK